MGYMGCAWAALGCYGSMMLASWWAGKVHYPIGYDVPRLCLYFFGALVLWGAGMLVTIPGNPWASMALRTPLLLLYCWGALRIEHVSLRSMMPKRR